MPGRMVNVDGVFGCEVVPGAVSASVVAEGTTRLSVELGSVALDAGQMQFDFDTLDLGTLAREMAEFHLACTAIAPQIPAGSKTVKSDAVHLLELLESPFGPRNFELPPESMGILWRHTHQFLENLIKFGYDDCNQDATDGCETSVLEDAKNCGA